MTPHQTGPRFLTTQGLSEALHEIIASVDDELLLLSPYLKFSEQVRDLLLERDRRQQRTHVLCRKVKSFIRAVPSLDGTRFVEIHFTKTIHAKCYVNKHAALVTSMNLHEYSAEHNDEMGFFITRRDSPDLFNQVQSDARRLVIAAGGSLVAPRMARASGPDIHNVVGITGASGPHVVDNEVQAARGPDVKWARPSTPEAAINRGFCIRCGDDVPLNQEEPLCPRDLRTWERFGDEDYPEVYCHGCGEGRDTCFRKPFCRACFRGVRRASA